MLNFYQVVNNNRFLRIVNKSFITLTTVRNWKTAFRDYRKKTDTEKTVLKLRSGLQLAIRANSVDAHDAVTVLSGQEYPYRWFRDVLKPNDIVLDIGAHVGAFTLFLNGKRPDLEIHAFEPAPDNFSLLRENVQANKLTNVKVWQKALAGKSGEVFLTTYGLDSNSYHLSTSGLRVEALSLDDFITAQNIKTISLLKLDCEGAEYEILENFKVIESTKAIVLEYHTRPDGKGGNYLVYVLEKNGFVLKQRKDLSDRSRGVLYFRKNSSGLPQ